MTDTETTAVVNGEPIEPREECDLCGYPLPESGALSPHRCENCSRLYLWDRRVRGWITSDESELISDPGVERWDPPTFEIQWRDPSRQLPEPDRLIAFAGEVYVSARWDLLRVGYYDPSDDGFGPWVNRDRNEGLPTSAVEVWGYLPERVDVEFDDGKV